MAMTLSAPIRRRASTALLLVPLAAYVVFLAFPLLWLASTSLKHPNEIIVVKPTVIPRAPTLDNYREVLGPEGVVRASLNTMKVAVASAVLALAVALPAAYALARRRSRLNTAILGWILVSQSFPSILIIVPLFLILARLSLANTHLGLIVVYVVWSLPFVLWILHGFVKGLPVELEEAAAVDGASFPQILFRILMPLLLPGLATTLLYAFVNAWNEFFFALVVLKDPDLMTIQVSLSRFRGLEGLARWGPLAAGSVVATLPALVAFGFLQRRLVSGLLSGGLKH